MTGFSVDEEALENISANLRRQATYCEEAIDHLDKHFSQDHSGGVFVGSVNQASQSVYHTIRDWFKVASSECFSAAAERIDSAAKYYHSTDEDTAADFDSAIDLLGSGSDLSISSEQASEVFADGASATEAFNDPPIDYSQHDEYSYSPDILGSISIAGGLRATVYGVTNTASWIGLMDGPFDTHEALVTPVSGDWAQVRANADVLDHFANFVEYLADTIERVRAQLPESWTGNAARLFDEYLSKLEADFRASAEDFIGLGKQYKDVTEEIVTARETVTFLGDLIADKALLASAKVIAAKLTIATPAAAITVPAAVFLVTKLLKGISKANTYVEGAKQVFTERSNEIVNYAFLNLPKPDDTSSAMTHLPE